MITRSPADLQRVRQREAIPLAVTPDWQSQLARALRDPHALCQRLGLDPAWLPGAEAGHRLFEVRVPEAFLARMRPGDPHDPLLRQVLP